MARGSEEHEAQRQPQVAPRFRAFVSYSHADAANARWLQGRLEAYRVPGRLAHRLGPLGDGRGRMGQVFRDREDLPAAADLSAAVRDAIAGSQALIIVCSPAAARSRWVAREITLFAAIHPDRPILAALFDGEPEQALPPALADNGAEPLAADFRQAGDGRRLAFLKLVAGLLALPLDELIQRDAQRRQRRVTAVTVAAMAMMLVLSAMTAVALSARYEAEQQRAEAEGLVSYMLTDLRERLKGVGRLDIMDDVNRRAIAFYADQGRPETLPDDSLERRAMIIGAMGEDAQNAGDLNLAETRYLILHKTTQALLAKHPRDPARIFAHARSENRLALLAITRERLVEAAERLRRTRALLATISDWGVERADWLRLSAYAHGNSCATLLKRRLPARRALPECTGAVALNERLAALFPGDRGASYDLVFHYLWLAEAQIAADRPAEARVSQARYLDLMRRQIARDPDNMLWREQEMELYVRHARLLRSAGDAPAGRRFLVAAKGLADRLIARDPNNSVWSRYRSRVSQILKEE